MAMPFRYAEKTKNPWIFKQGVDNSAPEINYFDDSRNAALLDIVSERQSTRDVADNEDSETSRQRDIEWALIKDNEAKKKYDMMPDRYAKVGNTYIGLDSSRPEYTELQYLSETQARHAELDRAKTFGLSKRDLRFAEEEDKILSRMKGLKDKMNSLKPEALPGHDVLTDPVREAEIEKYQAEYDDLDRQARRAAAAWRGIDSTKKVLYDKFRKGSSASFIDNMAGWVGVETNNAAGRTMENVGKAALLMHPDGTPMFPGMTTDSGSVADVLKKPFAFSGIGAAMMAKRALFGGSKNKVKAITGADLAQMGEKGMIESAGDFFSDPKSIPFAGYGFDIYKNIKVRDAAYRLGGGYDYLSAYNGDVEAAKAARQNDENILQDYKNETLESSVRPSTVAGQVTDTVLNSGKFMTEIGLTGGVELPAVAGAAAKMGAKEAAKQSAKTIAKLAADSVLTSATPKAVGGQILPMGVAGAVERYNQDAIDAEGKLGNASASDALYKGVGDAAIERWSEATGGALLAAGAAPFKIMGGKATKAATGGMLLGLVPEKTAQMLRKVGFNGVAGEMAEEQVGRTMRYVTNIENDGASNPESADSRFIESFNVPKQELLVQGLSFLAMPLGFAGAHKAFTFTGDKLNPRGAELRKEREEWMSRHTDAEQEIIMRHDKLMKWLATEGKDKSQSEKDAIYNEKMDKILGAFGKTRADFPSIIIGTAGIGKPVGSVVDEQTGEKIQTPGGMMPSVGGTGLSLDEVENLIKENAPESAVQPEAKKAEAESKTASGKTTIKPAEDMATRLQDEINRQEKAEEQNRLGVGIVKTEELNIDPARFQFKSNANSKTGVDESNKISGEFDHKTVGNILVWEDKDGKKYVVNGHHRYQLAREKGIKELNAVVLKESEGVSATDARRQGVLTNIRDGQGSVRDYAEFVRGENMDEATAQKEGILAREKGKQGYIIGKYASDNLFAHYINSNGAMSDHRAAAIAEAAKGDSAIESIGIKSKLGLAELREFLKLAKTVPREKSADTGDLFGFDDSAIKEMEEMSRLAARHINGIKATINAAKRAIYNPIEAKKLNVHVGSAAEKLLSEKETELVRWEKWATDAELYGQLRSEIGETKPEASEKQTTNKPQVNAKPAEGKGESPAQGGINDTIKAHSGIDFGITEAETLNGVQKRITKIFKDTFDTNVVFFNAADKNAPDGFFISGDSRIYVNTANSKPYLFTAFHEFYHRLEKTSPDNAAKMRNDILSIAGSDKLSAWKDAYNKKVTSQGLPKLGDAELEQEFMADTLGTITQNETFWRKLAKENPTMLQQFLDFLKSIREKFTKAEIGMVLNKEMEKAESMIAAVLKDEIKKETEQKLDTTVKAEAIADVSPAVESESNDIDKAVADIKRKGSTRYKGWIVRLVRDDSGRRYEYELVSPNGKMEAVNSYGTLIEAQNDTENVLVNFIDNATTEAETKRKSETPETEAKPQENSGNKAETAPAAEANTKEKSEVQPKVKEDLKAEHEAALLEFMNSLAKKTGRQPEEFRKIGEDLIGYIKNKDIANLIDRLNGINPASNRLFTIITGLPTKTEKERRESIRSLAPEKWDNWQKEKALEYENLEKERAQKKINDAIGESVNFRGTIVPYKEVIDTLLKEGYSPIEKPRGAAKYYVLENLTTKRELKLKDKLSYTYALSEYNKMPDSTTKEKLVVQPEAKAETGRFDMNSETPLLSAEEDKNDFQLKPETAAEEKKNDAAKVKADVEAVKRREEEQKKASPELWEPEDKHIGKNEEGKDLYEDKHGVRYYYETVGSSKFKSSEPVAIIPGGGFHVHNRRDRYKTVEERQKEKAQNGQVESVKNEMQRDVLSEIRGAIESDGAMIQKNVLLKKVAREYNKTEKDVQELAELVIAQMAKEIAGLKISDSEKFDKLVGLYEKQPNLGVRSSTSVANQAYSTPVPLAWGLGNAIGLPDGGSVYEPTAGTGFLLLASNSSRIYANEINPMRKEILEQQGYKATGHDATEYLPDEKVDHVIMNPPFGTTDKRIVRNNIEFKALDHIIAIKALEAMEDNGTAGIIVGANTEGPRGTGKASYNDWLFMNYLYNMYNVTGNYIVDGGLYSKQGASYPVRVLSIAGRKTFNGEMESLAPKTIEKLTSWDEVKTKLAEVKNVITGIETERGREIGGDTGHAGHIRNTDEGEKPAEGHNQLSGRDGGTVVKGNGGSGRGGSVGSAGDSGRSGGTGIVRKAGSKEALGQTVQRTDDEIRDSGVVETSVAEQPGERTGRRQSENNTPSASGRSADGTVSSAVNDEPVERVDRRIGEKVSSLHNKYVPYSKAEAMDTVAPKYMADAMLDSLDQVKEKYGDIDKFVAKELKYPSVEEMYKAFGAEQIDGIALALAALKRNSSIIIADQTGIGKGRQVAGLLRKAILDGERPIFFTKDPKLFSDMYQDGLDIGFKFKPFLIGEPSKSSIYDKDNNIAIKAMSVKSQKALFDSISGGKNNDYNCIFICYTQVNQKKQADFIAKVSKNNLVVMDEAHEAAGDSERGYFFRGGSVTKKNKHGVKVKVTHDGILNNCRVVYTSATFAKRPENMLLYFKTSLLKAFRNKEAIEDVVKTGGTAIQQVMSKMLASAGELVRRERDFSGVTFDTHMHKSADEKEITRTYDAVAAVLAEMTNVSSMIKDEVESSDDYVKANTREDSSVEAMSFGSVAHNYISQLLLAIKADIAAERAIEAHKSGKKPIIALSNTMGSALDEYVNENGLSKGDVVNLKYSDLLRNAMKRMLKIKEKGADGKVVEKEYKSTGEIKIVYDSVMGLIDTLDDIALPISPIDWMLNKMKSAGMNVSEITGRKYTIDYSGKKPVLAVRDDKGKNKTVNSFNGGQLDGLILNQSGSTGLSLHSAKKFKDQKIRKMIVAQPHLDINVMQQMFGRILRSGQVVAPEYELLVTPLTAEKRPMMVLSRKLVSLNANTTANSKGAVDLGTDFLNKYGDEIAANFLAGNEDISTRLGIDVDKKSDGTAAAAKEDLMKKLCGKMALLSDAEQEAIYAELEDKYNEHVNELKAREEYNLELTSYDNWEPKTLKSITIESGNPNSIFNKPLEMREVEVNEKKHIPSVSEVEAELKKNFPNGINSRLNDDMEKLRKELESADEDKKAKGETVLRMFERHVRNASSGMMAVRDGEFTYYGKLSDYKIGRGNPKNPIIASRFTLKFMVGDSVKRISIPLGSFLAGNASFNETRSKDDAVFTGYNRVERSVRTILTGNILRGMEYAQAGSVVSYKDGDEMITGVMMPKSWKRQDLARDPAMEMKDASEVMEYIKNGNTATDAAGHIAIIKRSYGNNYYFTVPKSKKDGGQYYLDEGLTDITGEFYSRGNKMIPYNLSEDKIKEVVKYLSDKGVIFKKTTNVSYSVKDTPQEQYDAVVKKFKGTDKWLKAPNGEDTKLTERQWVQVRTPNFKAWFGDWEKDPANASKVVDQNGEPMVVYKGMLKKDWRTKEDINVINSTNGPWAGFFTSREDVADSFKKAFSTMSESKVISVFLKIDAPYTFNARGNKYARDFMFDNTVFGQKPRNPDALTAFDNGYDAIVIKNTIDEGDVFVPKNSTQIKSATENTGAFGRSNPDIRYSVKDGTEYAPVFYSQMARVINDYKGDKIAAQGLENYLKSRGVKSDEIKWSGILQFAEGKKSIDKTELLQFIRDNDLEIEEKTLGSESEDGEDDYTKFSEYKLKGGSNYREVMFILPTIDWHGDSSHWDDRNVIAHVRIQDFTDDNANRILFVEEVQSDWHEKGREKGYSGTLKAEEQIELDTLEKERDSLYSEDGFLKSTDLLREWNGSGKSSRLEKLRNKMTGKGMPPDAPWKDTWHELVMKRALRMAAEGDYDVVAWTTGDMQNKRYPDESRNQEAMPNFYDVGGKSSQNIPRFMNKYVKQWGSGVRDVELETGDIVPGVNVTEAMKRGVLYEGQVKYSVKDTSQEQYDAVVKKFKGTDKWLKAPNGKDTKLTERQWVQVRTPAFKAWFGDWENDPENASKVVDENGEPLVVYHGTEYEFNVFEKSKLGSNTEARLAKTGFFFASDREAAEIYAYGGDVKEIFLDIKNPKDVNFGYHPIDHSIIKDIREAKKDKRDGFIVFNTKDPIDTDVYIVFEPTQIKSATENTGAFGRSNLDIRYSVKDMPLVIEDGELKGLEDVSMGELQRMAHRQGVAKKDYAASLGKERIAENIGELANVADVKFSLKAGKFSPIVIDANVIRGAAEIARETKSPFVYIKEMVDKYGEAMRPYAGSIWHFIQRENRMGRILGDDVKESEVVAGSVLEHLDKKAGGLLASQRKKAESVADDLAETRRPLKELEKKTEKLYKTIRILNDAREDIVKKMEEVSDFIKDTLTAEQYVTVEHLVRKIAQAKQEKTRERYVEQAKQIIVKKFERYRTMKLRKETFTLLKSEYSMLNRAADKGKTHYLSPDFADAMKEYISKFKGFGDFTRKNLEDAITAKVKEYESLGYGADNEKKESLALEIAKMEAENSRLDVMEMSAEQLETVLLDLEAIRKTGRRIRDLLEDKRRRTINAVGEEIGTNIRKNRGYGESNFRKLLGKSSFGLADKALRSLLTPETKIEAITKYEDYGISKGAILQPMLDAENTEIVNTRESLLRLNKILKPVEGDLLKPFRTYKDVENDKGKKEDIDLNIGQALFIYLNSRNENNRRHIEATFGETIVSGVVKELPEKYKKAADELWDFYDNWMYPRINRAFRKEHGVDMPQEKYYFPIRNLMNQKAEENAMMQEIMQRAKYGHVEKGLTRLRMKSELPYRKIDLLGTIGINLREAEHYIGFADAVRDVNAVLNSEGLRTALDDVYPELRSDLMGWVRTCASGKITNNVNWADTASEWLRNNMAAAVLGFNVTSAMVQPVGILNGIAVMQENDGNLNSVGYVLDSLREIAASPIKWNEFINGKSPMMLERMNSSIRELAEIKERDVQHTLMNKGLFRKAKNAAMFPMQFVDKASCDILWLASYRQELNKSKDEKKAVRWADEVIRKSQSMGGAVHQADVMTGGGVWRMATFMMGQSNRVFNIAYRGLARAKNHPAEAGAMLFWNMMAAGVVENIIRSGFTPEPPDKLPEKWLLSIIKPAAGGMPGGEIMANGAIDMASMHIREYFGLEKNPVVHNYSMSPSGIGALENMFKSAWNIGKIPSAVNENGWGDKETDRAVDFAAAAGTVFGIPASGQARKTYKGLRRAADMNADKWTWAAYGIFGKYAIEEGQRLKKPSSTTFKSQFLK